MKNLLLIVSMAWVVLNSATCKTDKAIGVWMVYTENQCANPFEVTENPATTQQNLKNYLKQNGINPQAMKYERYKFEMVCLACNCPKTEGYYHYALITENDKPKAKDLGLTEK